MDLQEEYFLKINIEAVVMKTWKRNNIESTWANICKCEGEIFRTVKRKKPYTYAVVDDYIIINGNVGRGRITKEMLERALFIDNPSPSKIGGWAPSYICGIITDSRVWAKNCGLGMRERVGNNKQKISPNLAKRTDFLCIKH